MRNLKSSIFQKVYSEVINLSVQGKKAGVLMNLLTEKV